MPSSPDAASTHIKLTGGLHVAEQLGGIRRFGYCHNLAGFAADRINRCHDSKFKLDKSTS